MGHVLGAVKDTFSEVPDRAREAAHDIADRVEDALESAGTQGRKLSKRVRKELKRRWAGVDQTGRDNAYVMALGALGIGILVGYLLTRDND